MVQQVTETYIPPVRYAVPPITAAAMPQRGGESVGGDDTSAKLLNASKISTAADAVHLRIVHRLVY